MSPKKILIVDDEEFFIEPIKLLLERNGYEVIKANDGMLGLIAARTQNPDLILLDLMLPGINGYQVCRLLKYDEKYKHIPMMIVSAKDTEKDKQLGKACGADLYLTKPLNYMDLVKQIGEILQ